MCKLIVRLEAIGTVKGCCYTNSNRQQQQATERIAKSLHPKSGLRSKILKIGTAPFFLVFIIRRYGTMDKKSGLRGSAKHSNMKEKRG
jgi:hypothetical protein